MSASPITVAEVIELYLTNLRARNAAGDYSDLGCSNAHRDLRRFAEMFGAKTIAECKQHDVSAFFAAHPQFKSTNTKKRVAATITACFGFAFDEELIDRRPYRLPRLLRGLPNETRRPATPQEYIALMSHKSSRALRRALYFLRRTGARTCEMRALTWDDLHLDGPVPYIELATHKTRKKTGQSRKIGLDKSTARFLRNLRRQAMAGWPSFTPQEIDVTPRVCTRCLKEQPTSNFPMAKAKGKAYRHAWCISCRQEYDRERAETRPDRRHGVKKKRRQRNANERHVFLNCEGGPWDVHTFARHLSRQATRIGLGKDVADRVSAYCLRHLYVVDAIEAGITTRRIADQIGHASTAMIDSVYGSHTRHRVEHLSDVANEIAHGRNKMTRGKKDDGAPKGEKDGKP